MENQLEKLYREIENTQVVVMAGGKAKRMGLIDRPKALLRVSGRTLLDLCIQQYISNGFRNFVILLGYKHDMIIKHLEEQSYDVSITYCVDPPIPHVGKGKALKYALEQGKIDRGKRAIIAFPDDVFHDPNIPIKLLLQHLQGVRLYKTIATATFAAAIDYPYGVAKIDSTGLVTLFREKPEIKILTSVGLYLFEPEVYEIIMERIDLEAPYSIEFENTILPLLSEQRKLYSYTVPKGLWTPVNTLKQLEELERILST